jgi:hypothetical protein
MLEGFWYIATSLPVPADGGPMVSVRGVYDSQHPVPEKITLSWTT